MGALVRNSFLPASGRLIQSFVFNEFKPARDQKIVDIIIILLLSTCILLPHINYLLPLNYEINHALTPQIR
jgi:hypothetical protein